MLPAFNRNTGHAHHSHIPSIVAIATRVQQCKSDWRGLGHMGAGVPGPHSIRPRMPLLQHCQQELINNIRSVVHPRWIMDQLYIVLATLHTVLVPLALLRVQPRLSNDRPLRTIGQQGRFVQAFTKNIICLAQAFMPHMFLETCTECVFPESDVLRIIQALIDAAVRGNSRPRDGCFTFCWEGFYLDSQEYEMCCNDTLRGFIAAMTHEVEPDW